MKKINANNIPKLAFVMGGLYTSARYRMLKHLLNNYYPADLVLALKEYNTQDIVNILRVADQKTQVGIFQYFSPEFQLDIIPLLKDFEVRYYFENLPADDRTTLLREMDPEIRELVLKDISQQERDIATTLLSYDEDSAGAIATQGATTLENWTIQQTLDQIRTQSSYVEDVHMIYVLNEDSHLVGIVSLEQIIFTDPQEMIKDIMSPDPMFIRANQPKEDAVEAIQKYDIVSLPVLDEEKKMIGIITYDDAMDLIIQQGTEDMYRFAGVSTKEGSSEETYLKQPILLQVKRRFTWTIIPIFMEIVTGAVVGGAEHLLQSIFILATFIPMIAAAGGNIGSQSASLITRAIALKEVSFGDIVTVLKREFAVAFIISLFCCSILVIKMILFPHVVSNVPFHLVILTVTLALGAQLIVSALLGAFVPLLAVKLKIDPAIMSSPVLASSVDIIGLLMYFGIAKLILF